MFVVLVVLLTMLWPGIAIIKAQCRAPLTLMLTGQNYWEARIGETLYKGPFNGKQTLVPYSSHERVTNITVYVERSTIAIGVSVDSKYVNANNSFIASVSYNGVKLSTTGDTVSRWKYTTDYGEISRWWTNSYYTDDSLWTSVNSIGLCNANTVPSINRDGFSFSELISANGVTPTKNSPQFGGETARWIGVNENNGDCSIKGAVVYRMTLDLTALADEPVCYSKDDGRSLLSSNTPILSFPNIGVKSPTSQVLTFIGSVQGFLGVWVDGLGSQGRESYSGDLYEHLASFAKMEFNIEPKSTTTVAIYVSPGTFDQMFIANIFYKGQLFAASDNFAQWKVFAGDMEPIVGWNTDPNFDDSSWKSMSDTFSCRSPIALSQISLFLNKTYGGCAKWFWHKSGCKASNTPLYVRIPLNLVNEESRPALECSMPLPVVIVNQPKNSNLEIVAIASSATIGSFMMIAAYLFVRRHRSRRSKMKMLSNVEVVQLSKKTSTMVPPSSPKKWSMWSRTGYEETTSHSSTIHLAHLSGVDIRPRLMGEQEKTRAMHADDRSGSIACTSILQTDASTNALPELIKAYQSKQRSIGLEKLKLQPSAQKKTRVTHDTQTELTLVDGTTQGLELPGFLEIYEGVDYNLDDEFASGGGGSLFTGCMFAVGLPSLKVIIKKMTDANLPAFRQEVALMWLFNDNENMVKLMGFNETQLAIVMPVYKMGSLKRFIDVGDYDCKVARSLLLDIAKGLLVMHDRGVVHQDIKPDNILLEPHPTKRINALITDFGISNVVEDKILTVKAFEVKSKGGLTVRYAAPEVITRFQNKYVSRASPAEAKAGDVYSFAMVIHALLENIRLSK